MRAAFDRRREHVDAAPLAVRIEAAAAGYLNARIAKA
jgi:hypothetical protein